ncbi:hypothetical protein JYT29_01480 [Nitrospina gracilis]|nr:hypothetical protein [Nitrospina gracilis]
MYAIKRDDSLEKNGVPVIGYDSEYLRFAYWSTLLNFSGSYSGEIWNKQKTILLNNGQHKPCSLQGITNTPISLQNNYNYPVFNLYIYSSATKKIIFELPELPENKSIKLEFNKDGVYELYFSAAGSSSISKTTFSISQTKNSYEKNFHWKSESLW